jgi:foldase protein PrsA
MRLVKLLCAGIAVLSFAAAPLWAAGAAGAPDASSAAAVPQEAPAAQTDVKMRPELETFHGIKAWRVNGEEIPIETVQERAMLTHGPYVLQDLVVERLLLQEAKRRGVSVSDAETEAKVNEIRQEMGLTTPEAFDHYLRSQEATEAAFRNWAREYVLAEKLFADQVFVSDDEAATFYNQRRQLYHTPDTVVFRAIMLGTEAAAQQALVTLRSGRDFAALAKELAPDSQTRAFAGEMQTHQRGSNPNMPKEVEDALFKAPVSQATIIKVGPQWAVVRVEKRAEAHDLSLEQVRDQIKKDIRRMKLTQAVLPGWIRTQLAAAEIIPIPASGASAAK